MLSDKATEFLANLNIYLQTYGKNEKDIREIVNELEDHLIQAEKSGKNIDTITGGSPKAYMNQIKNEMNTDRKEILSTLFLFFSLALAYIILPDAIRGQASFTIIEIIGNMSAIIISIVMFVWLFRYDSSNTISKSKQIAMFWVIGAVPFAIFFGTHFLNKWMGLKPIFEATPFQNSLIAVICIVFLIGYAIFAKTWSTIIVPCIIIAPNFIAERITGAPKDQSLLTLGLFFGGIVLLLLYFFVKNKREMKAVK
ncbi:HAAS domain-containing protein [Heyndrickxia sp. NPDC080065]|uniref:HAAS domain-containing protein n=1 Tax=Heyndrickxia sp. NPDC080065 TaxID=3390568 RepID=UPI003D063EEE